MIGSKEKGTMMSEQVTTNYVNQGEGVRLMCVGVLAGAIAGLVTGIGARINMRIIALAAGSVPELSLATLVILLTGILYGILPGMLYVAVKKYLPGPGLLKGVTFGLLGSLLLGLPIFLIPVSAANDFSIGPPLLGRSLFTALPIVYGVALGLVEPWLTRTVPAPNTSEKKLVYLYSFMAILVFMAVLVALMFLLSVASLIFPPSG